jgi:hypothetical protein
LEAAEVSEEASEEEALAAAAPLDHGDPSLKLRTMQISFAKASDYADSIKIETSRLGTRLWQQQFIRAIQQFQILII